MTDSPKLGYLLPEAFDYLRTISVQGEVEIRRNAPLDHLREVSDALPKALRVECHLDEERLSQALEANGVPVAIAKDLVAKLSLKVEMHLHDHGLPGHLDKRLIF